MSKWQPIETAPKDIVDRQSFTSNSAKFHEYGPYILACEEYGRPRVMRWWSVSDEPDACNFMGDCGNAYRPKWWQPLPEPPK